MMADDPDLRPEINIREGMQFVCTLPSAAIKLSVENGCVIADLENGERFLVPVECGPEQQAN